MNCKKCDGELQTLTRCVSCQSLDGATECTWTQQDNIDGSDWETSCGELFTFIDATPKDNGMNFCCYCGSRLVERLYEPGPDYYE